MYAIENLSKELDIKSAVHSDVVCLILELGPTIITGYCCVGA